MIAACPWCGDGPVVPGQGYCRACLDRLCVRCETHPRWCNLDICWECERADERRQERARQMAEREAAEMAEGGPL